MRLKLITATIVVVATALVLASCGGDDGSATTTASAETTTTANAESTTTLGSEATTQTTTEATTQTTTEAGSGALAITAGDDLRFTPDTVVLSPGQEVELTFRNASSVQHSLAVLNADAELEHVLTETDEEHLHEELYFDIHETDGGEEITETFTAPSEPGEYVFACLVPGHADAGMTGTLVVE